MNKADELCAKISGNSMKFEWTRASMLSLSLMAYLLYPKTAGKSSSSS